MSLKGKNVFFLGSSVTYGSAAGGVSFAEMMAEIAGINCFKEAVSGTTLADRDESSYVSRLKRAEKPDRVDLFICQLSSNDAARNIPLPEVEAAIRFISAYAGENFCCPVVFYTSPDYESSAYFEMVKLLNGLKAECGISVLDFYNDPEMRGVSDGDYKRFMHDPVHPTAEGYREWWTPKFLDFCEKLFEK